MPADLESVEIESLLIVITAPIWFLGFALLFAVDAVGDWWRARG